MLSNHEALAPAMLPVWIEPARHENGTPSDKFHLVRVRFGADDASIVDVGAVSGKYHFVSNSDIINCVDAVADRFRLDFEPGKPRAARLTKNGHSRMLLHAPAYSYRVPGDPSDIIPMLAIDNGYDGGTPVRFTSGGWRYSCQNLLLWFGEIASSEKRIHKGNWSLEQFVCDGLEALREKIDADRQIAEVLTRVDPDPALVVALYEATPERYRLKFTAAVERYRAEIGRNAWSIVQAASEIVSHTMLRKGQDTWSSDVWMRNMVNSVLESDAVVAARK